MISVVKPGLMTTIQDYGRFGYQAMGIIENGVMDQQSAAVANIMVGNSENQAVIEACIFGPELLFGVDTIIAITGANLKATINNQAITTNQLIYIKKGSTLKITHFTNGVYAYIAIAGGINLPDVLGSKSTYLKANIGGFKGRALLQGDVIPINQKTSITKSAFKVQKQGFLLTKWKVTHSNLFFKAEQNNVIRVIKGVQFDYFDKSTIRSFLNQKYQITSKSDRIGYRLQGEKLNKKQQIGEMLSEAVALGSIQIANDGQPIVLLADRQTLGGYPKIANIISADIAKFVQLTCQSLVSFKFVKISQAHQALLEKHHQLARLKIALSQLITGA